MCVDIMSCGELKVFQPTEVPATVAKVPAM